MTFSWDIIYTTEFLEWFATLDGRQVRSVQHRLELLRSIGPSLGRPHVDHVKGSTFPNMKELRVNVDVAIRIFFCFDSRRRAVILIGGVKTSQKHWYRQKIKQAESIMDSYLGKGYSQ
jgi:hypothetical protein